MADQLSAELSLLDESFIPFDTRNYGLSMVLNETGFSCCILDFRRNKFIGLHRFVRSETLPREGQQDSGLVDRNILMEVSEAIPWLKNSFKLVKIAFDGRKATLIPGSLFDLNQKDQYFNFNFKRETAELIECDHLVSLDAWQIFAVPETIAEAAGATFPKSRVIHVSSLLVESVWINYKNRINTPHVFLHVRDPLFDLMIFNGRQMQYFNTFSFQNPEDVAYYLIFVLEQLHFNPETIPLVFLGNVNMGDNLTELLFRYIRHIEPGKRNEAYSYSYLLDKLPPQHCFPLLNFFSCAL